MPIKDTFGLTFSGATEAGFTPYSQAVSQLQCFIGDPVASVDRAIAENPGFVMAHVFKGYLFGLATERDATAVARTCHEAALPLAATTREQAHVLALGHLAGGRWHDAARILEDIAIDAPLDAVALQVGHQIDFFTGNARMLRDRIARALPSWQNDMPGYHAMLGMEAFGLEEMGEYALAEKLGRTAVGIEPRDGWAQHAVAHVMEMQSRQRDGIAWMRADPEAWTRDSFLQVHNWWHLALFHYDLGETDEVLALYDGPIYGTPSAMALNMVDASAILWRLYLGGVDVGDRWSALAANWPKVGAGNYAFNDAHAMMAFVGAGLDAPARTLVEAQREAMRGNDDNAAFTRDVGHPLTLAINAFGAGNYSEAMRLIRPIRAIAHRFGGSHAQRDIIDLTLIEAALRAGDGALARALTAERSTARPDSPLSALFSRRAADLSEN
ncbi:tetratricopeptide repeat protein [Mesorhizobium sp. NZP2077]|uniref:tetratricopeptide repeat protein n=1 Tax=Mesorhizobium sp. NZP2077 TaxID=2483404 RepID=UPI0015574AE7|nr:tetratricopeptide repeat protein [Mesorhizobium sp. NZP2077]QKC80626.1 tetratricopeptide repeat protein [Mesorhizobium sp. NZP2077]QKD14017.1 tetratricopeptide repeat protein [Mesorhizobium sp. NZP2077]